MKKIIQKEKIEYRCDNCEIIIDFPVIKLEFNYGSEFDEESFIFCSDKCLKKFVEEKIK